jgi:hypothetical protein
MPAPRFPEIVLELMVTSPVAPMPLPEFPEMVLELTVFHEMCHQAMPPVRRNGQWQTHHKDFKAKEKEYRHYREAIRWEKKHWIKLMAPSPGQPS